MWTSALKFLKRKKVRHFTGFQEFIAEMICKLNSKLSLTPVSKSPLPEKWSKKGLSTVIPRIPKLMRVKFPGLDSPRTKISRLRTRNLNLQRTFYLTWRPS